MNLRQIKVIEKTNKEKWLKLNNSLTEDSGIYVLVRKDSGFKFAYVGQAKHILTRLAEHLKGYQHIDLSLRNHGLYSDSNPSGWQVYQFNYSEDKLDEMEQYYINKMANKGYQLRNKTAGGQGKGKINISGTLSTKGFREGIARGIEKNQKEISHLFKTSLEFSIKGKPNKNKQKAYDKFLAFVGGNDGNSER